MARRPTLNDLKKNSINRAGLWLAGTIILLLIDEYIKEGYWFDPNDITILGTHEFIIVNLFMLLVVWVLHKVA